MMPIVDFGLSLQEDAKATFDKQGFVAIDRITTDEETAWFRGVYDGFLTARVKEAIERPKDNSSHLGNTLWISLDKWESFLLRKTALCRNAVQLAAGLLDVPPETITVGLRFFFKPAGGGKPVPWHQDEAHQDPAFDHHSLNVWVPFDASNEENGCLWYIPGSHLGGIRVHRHPGNGAPEVALMTDDVRTCEAVPVPLAAGGASFHHCRTLHSSGSNTTDGHRRALVVVCRAPPQIREIPAERPWLTLGHVPETSF
jgi:ectoine hydroxylase-related dioxygenase (phytanoyl-CoA dioxygenase family)